MAVVDKASLTFRGDLKRPLRYTVLCRSSQSQEKTTFDISHIDLYFMRIILYTTKL